jgi:Ca-activated chloride channel family protein
MVFEAPLLLLLAPVVALVIAAGAWFARRQRIRRAAAWSPELAASARARGGWAPAVLGAAALLVAVAAAGPRGGRAQVTAKTRALSLVMAMDISRSMLAEDAQPNRLQHAIREARRLTQDLQSDRLGLIAFAGRSYILAPLTVDGSGVRLFLDALDPDLASEGGTSLASVLRQGTDLLGAGGAEADRVLVIFTDGETHDSLDDALAAAAALKARGVRLVLVAEGGPEPVRIPLRDSTGTIVQYKLDENGQPVETQRRDDILKAVADAGDGTIVGADLADQAGAVRELVSTYKRAGRAEARVADLLPRGWIPALAAALLLLGYSLGRRGAALVCLALMALPASARAQRPGPGERAYAAGAPASAAAAFLRDARTGRGRDTAFYNAGTAAMRAGRLDIAQGALAEAAKSLDPALRYRALYNLGVLSLAMAQADSSKRDALLGEAVDRLRDALLLEPGSPRAKWNLELAERRRPPPPPSKGGGAGGGGGGAPPPPPPSGKQPPPPPGLSQSQAEQILNSMDREERRTRADQQKRLQPPTASGVKDW